MIFQRRIRIVPFLLGSLWLIVVLDIFGLLLHLVMRILIFTGLKLHVYLDTLEELADNMFVLLK